MRPLRRLQPALAAFLAACVLLLGFAAWSPTLHEELCAHEHERAGLAHTHGEHPDDDHGVAPASSDHVCAVTLFAGGCDAPPSPLWIAATAAEAARIAAFTEWMLARTLRGPERVCGPPSLA